MAGRSYDPGSYDLRWGEVETSDSYGRRCYWMFPKVGSIFGSLTVIEQEPHRRWVSCLCDLCGGVSKRSKRYLLDFSTDACCVECSHANRGERVRAKHPGRQVMPSPLLGMWMHRWTGIISRCYNEESLMYHAYGGRGIKVHQAWLDDYTEFLRYATTLGGWDAPSLDLDRIDNEGNYEPGNLRLVARRVSTNNRRSTIYVEFRGQVYTASDLLRQHFNHLPHSTFLRYLRRGLLVGVTRFSKGIRPDELRAETQVHDSNEPRPGGSE